MGGGLHGRVPWAATGTDSAKPVEVKGGRVSPLCLPASTPPAPEESAHLAWDRSC